MHGFGEIVHLCSVSSSYDAISIISTTGQGLVSESRVQDSQVSLTLGLVHCTVFAAEDSKNKGILNFLKWSLHNCAASCLRLSSSTRYY